MKNKIVLSLLLGCFFLTGCATTHVAVKRDSSFAKYKKIYLHTYEDDPRKVLPKVQKRLEQLGFRVILTKEDEPVGGYQGTGFIITSDGYILTTAHIFGKSKVATVWINDKRYLADLIVIEKGEEKEDDKEDAKKKKDIKELLQASLDSEDNKSILEQIDEKGLALLKLRSSEETFNPLIIPNKDSYKIGLDVYTIGFPLSCILGDKARLNKGLVSSTVGIKDNPDFVQVSVEIQPGNSGGPLLDQQGKVIGIIEMTINPLRVMSETQGAMPQNVNFAVKNHVIRDFLDRCSEKAQLKLRTSGQMSFDEVQNSVVKISSDIVPEGFKKESKLACSVAYSTIWDMWYRFTYLDIFFYDLDTEEVLLRAGQYGDNPLSSENKTLDSVFKEIAKKISNIK